MSDENNQPLQLRQAPDIAQLATDIDVVVQQEQPTMANTLRMLAQSDDVAADTHARRRDLGAIYARVNPGSEDRLDAQTKACLRYAKTAGIIVPVAWRFVETASGFGVRPPGYQQMMRLARDGRARHVITLSCDRLGRDLSALMLDLQDLKRLGVRLHTHLGEVPLEMLPDITASEMDACYRVARARPPCRQVSSGCAGGILARAHMGAWLSHMMGRLTEP